MPWYCWVVGYLVISFGTAVGVGKWLKYIGEQYDGR